MVRLLPSAPSALRLRLVALAAVAFAAGCAGPPIPAPIEDLPLCADFTAGKTQMAGSLKLPVRLRVLDGKTVLYKTIITGLRHPDDPKPASFIVDDNAKYRVEWAQCANPRAPRSALEAHHKSKGHAHERDDEGTSYDCGEATIYKGDDVLATKKGDRASHVIHYVAPPDPTCWTSDAPEHHEATIGPAGDAGSPDVDAGGGPADGGGGTGAAPVTDAGADAAK